MTENTARHATTTVLERSDLGQTPKMASRKTIETARIIDDPTITLSGHAELFSINTSWKTNRTGTERSKYLPRTSTLPKNKRERRQFLRTVTVFGGLCTTFSSTYTWASAQLLSAR